MAEITFPALPFEQPVGPLYAGVIDAKSLLSMCEFEYRTALINEKGDVDFMGIQRPYNDKRVAEISKYVGTKDATFPTAIVISIDERTVSVVRHPNGLATITVSDFVDPEAPENSVPLSEAARIIDGQHRLKGIEAAGVPRFDLPVTVFVGADDATRAAVFSTVNLAQTKVNRSLVYDLFAVAESRSPQKTAHEIAVALDTMEESPFLHRIKRLGVATKDEAGVPLPDREFEPLAQATVVRGLLNLITRDALMDFDRERRGRPVIVQPGDELTMIYRPAYAKQDDAFILRDVLHYFRAVRRRWRDAWSDETEGMMLARTNGFDAFIKFLRPAHNSITQGRYRLVTEHEYFDLFRDMPLEDASFRTRVYLPGTGGSAKLYRDLLRYSGLEQSA